MTLKLWIGLRALFDAPFDGKTHKHLVFKHFDLKMPEAVTRHISLIRTEQGALNFEFQFKEHQIFEDSKAFSIIVLH